MIHGGVATALEGDLRVFFLSEVLQFLQLAQSSGRLLIERPGENAELRIDRGRLVAAHTSGGSVRLGEILVHNGALARADLTRTLEAQRARPAERLGVLLIRSGTASRDQVAQAVQDVIKRILYGLMLWREGSFRFVPGESPECDDLAGDVQLDRLILEGLRQADQAAAVEGGGRD